MIPSPTVPTSVLVDASALSSVAARSGIGTYTRCLLSALAASPPVTDGTLSVSALVTSEVELDPAISKRTVRRHPTDHARAEVLEHALRVPIDARRHREAGGVFHVPGFHAPWGIGHPWVQTLHDLIPLALPEPDLEPLRKRWRRFGPRYRQADAIIAISRHAADEGIRLLGIDPGRVEVVHHGVDPAFSPLVGRDEPGGADPPYLLVVSEFSRRKGFGHAFTVVGALAERGYPHRLKVAGQIHDHARPELDRLRREAAHPERIDLLGFVDDLADLYRHASVVLVPSRYEGFGLPALEAMASGVPVVAYDNTALGEVVGGGGLLVADGDVSALEQAVRTVLDNRSAWAEWRARGLERAAGFSWAASAAGHAAVYQAVARRAPHATEPRPIRVPRLARPARQAR